ncbi:MAG: hypothetical protein R2843_06530 [Thermomicrobiales bacterium]
MERRIGQAVPGGSIEITESLPDGYVAVGVYCDDYASTGSPGDYQGVSIVNGSTVSYDLPDGYSLTCYWYNAPYEQEAYGNISLTKYVCPAEYDTNSVNQDYLSSTCTETQGGVEYQLYRDDGSSSPMNVRRGESQPGSGL